MISSEEALGACNVIEMKSYQRDWLIAQGFAKRHQIELLFDLRQRTLAAFKTMASERGIGVDDSIPIPLQGSRSIPPSSSRVPEAEHAPVIPSAFLSLTP